MCVRVSCTWGWDETGDGYVRMWREVFTWVGECVIRVGRGGDVRGRIGVVHV